MKKIISLTAAVLLLCSFMLTSCSGLVKMKFNDDSQLVSRDGTVYNFAPVGYEPTYQGDEYGYIDDAIGDKLYKINDIDPELWLTTEYTGATTTVYYNAEIDLPALSDMAPELCYLCLQDDNVYSLYTLGDKQNSDWENERELISALISALADDGKENCLWPRTDANETYQLKFYSSEWPAFYYNVVYTICDSGNYLYDRVNRRCIEVGSLLDNYFEDTYTEDTTGNAEV